jgi:hypothetical protein
LVNIFGFQIKRKTADEVADLPSPIEPIRDDGATVIQAVVGGSTGQYIDLDGSVKNEAELVTRYRQMVQNAELGQALVHIVNEAIVNEDDQDIVSLNFDESEDDEIPEKLTDSLIEAFAEVLRLLEFKTHAYEIFRTWYIDGRLYYHAIIDPVDIKAGIQELRYIDPRKIRKIREIKKVPDPKNKLVTTKIVNEFFIYNERGFGVTQKGIATETKGIKIAKDSIIHVTSGLTDEYGKMVLSYLHEAIKPLNQLRCLEDAAVIYRLVRAPERRIFYIDVGDLPKVKAEQYLRDMMTKFKNKLVYDATTGEVRDDRRFMTMLEDFWLPRRGDGKATQIDTLPGGENLGQMDDVLYFQKKLFSSLHVPLSRLNPEAMAQFGVATEITHEEVNFSRFVDRIRMRFSSLFITLLERQVILTGMMTPDEWADIKPKLKFKYARDTFFSELKNQQILQSRMEVLTLMMPFIGRFYSNEWVRTNILNQTEDDQKEMDKQIKKEASNPQYAAIDPATGLPQENPLDPNAIPNQDSPMDVDNAMAVTPQPTPQDEKLDKNGKPKPKPKPAGSKKK